MIDVTARARQELKGILSDNSDDPAASLRLVVKQSPGQ